MNAERLTPEYQADIRAIYRFLRTYFPDSFFDYIKKVLEIPSANSTPSQQPGSSDADTSRPHPSVTVIRRSLDDLNAESARLESLHRLLERQQAELGEELNEQISTVAHLSQSSSSLSSLEVQQQQLAVLRLRLRAVQLKAETKEVQSRLLHIHEKQIELMELLRQAFQVSLLREREAQLTLRKDSLERQISALKDRIHTISAQHSPGNSSSPNQDSGNRAP